MARAIDIYIDRFGVEISLFGGEPLLEPEVVREVFRLVARRDEIRWVYLSTNGLGLDSDWLDMLSAYPKGILTLSLDGTAEQNRRFRRPAEEGVGDAYDHIRSLLPQLLKTPRVVVTQTIAPAAAAHAAENFEHLLSLGFYDSTSTRVLFAMETPAATDVAPKLRRDGGTDGTTMERRSADVPSKFVHMGTYTLL